MIGDMFSALVAYSTVIGDMLSALVAYSTVQEQNPSFVDFTALADTD